MYDFVNDKYFSLGRKIWVVRIGKNNQAAFFELDAIHSHLI